MDALRKLERPRACMEQHTCGEPYADLVAEPLEVTSVAPSRSGRYLYLESDDPVMHIYRYLVCIFPEEVNAPNQGLTAAVIVARTTYHPVDASSVPNTKLT